MIVPFSAGGIYDTTGGWSRAQYGPVHSRKPTLIVQNQPSGGGLGLANRFAAGESDGTLIGTLQRGLPQLALTRSECSFRSTEAHMDRISFRVCKRFLHPVDQLEPQGPEDTGAAGSSAPLLRIGSNRAGSTNLTIALVVQHALGLKHEIVRDIPAPPTSISRNKETKWTASTPT